MAKHGFPLSTACCAVVAVLIFGNCILALPDPLKCEGVKCPPMSEISCPKDSQIREYIDLSSDETTNDTSNLDNELFLECCAARKCACKLCHIPSCQNKTLVIYELKPETQIPGRCCGEYDCRPEPNCTEIRGTDAYWLTDCQRCKCLYGERICHRSCDEIVPNPTASYCKSKNRNRFFSHGEKWEDGCYECECQNGEEKCVMPFCKSVDCPPSNQVIVEGRCCPVCLSDDELNPHHDHPDYKDENSDSDSEHEIQPPLAPQIIVTRPRTHNNTTSSTTTHAPVPPPPPCVVNEDPTATYAVYPEVVEVVHPANDHIIIYFIIAFETILLVICAVVIYNMRARKHSYNTVSTL